ncbi:hypothetical protein [Moraxella lacunata]
MQGVFRCFLPKIIVFNFGLKYAILSIFPIKPCQKHPPTNASNPPS